MYEMFAIMKNGEVIKLGDANTEEEVRTNLGVLLHSGLFKVDQDDNTTDYHTLLNVEKIRVVKSSNLVVTGTGKPDIRLLT